MAYGHMLIITDFTALYHLRREQKLNYSYNVYVFEFSDVLVWVVRTGRSIICILM